MEEQTTEEAVGRVERELKLQVEVNRRLARELIECRLELEKMKGRGLGEVGAG